MKNLQWAKMALWIKNAKKAAALLMSIQRRGGLAMEGESYQSTASRQVDG